MSKGSSLKISALHDSISNSRLLRAALALAGGMLLYLVSRYSYLLFHNLVEMVSIAVAGGVFMVAWNTRRFNQYRFISFLGAAYLFIGIIDMLHTLAYKGMNIFVGYGANLPTQLWIAGRYMESLALLTAVTAVERHWSMGRTTAGIGAVAVGLIAAIFMGWFPDCFVPGQGLTAFKIISEFIIMAIFGLVIVALVIKRDRFPGDSVNLLIWACVFSIGSDLSFSMYSDVYGILNQVGHYFNLASFYMIYLAAIAINLNQPYQTMFADLKRSEEAARKNEALLNQTQALARVGGWEWDAASGRIMATEEAYRIQGFTPGSPLTYADTLALIPAEARPAVEAAAARAFEEGQPHDIEFPLITAQERRLWVRQQVKVESEPGRPNKLIGFIQDITELKQAQQLREDVERMTAHDLRTPLNAVINLPQMITEDPHASDLHREIAELIREAGVSMARQIDQMLCVYKMEQGEDVVSRRDMDVVEAVRRTGRDLQAFFEQKNLTLDLLVNGLPNEDGTGLTAQADDLLIQVALINMIKNAVEASPPDRKVTVDLSSDRAGGVVIGVHNQGAVPKEIRDNFFDKYVTAGKRKGAGLGTYSVRLIARAHGGEASLEAGEEETRVVIHLPAPDRPTNC